VTGADYGLIDFGGLVDGGASDGGSADGKPGQRLERWGDTLLIRPDIRATGPRRLDAAAWAAADATFEGRVGGGQWIPRPGRSPALPDRWPIVHADLRFAVGCAPSGHTGLFPEQASHWAWMAEALDGRREAPAILNLFAYTGGASVALARAGAHVTHVDASRPAIGWAQQNAALNGVSTIRWIHEDARRFVDRERRRGRRYDGRVLDPPAFGRGPAGDWRLDRDLGALLEAAVALLAPDPAFVLVNVYTGEVTPGELGTLLAWALDARSDPGGFGPIEADTLTLAAADGRHLPTGIYARVRQSGPEVSCHSYMA
jgi:23S rRNA (cytosine1962-C5)-methyltransferase